MAAAVAAAAEAGEATTETPRKLADKRRPKKENAREKQRREMEEDALLQDRIREVEEEKLRQRIEDAAAAKEKDQLAEAKEKARLAANTTKLTKVAASPPPQPGPRQPVMAEPCFTHAPPGLVRQSEVFEEALQETPMAPREPFPHGFQPGFLLPRRREPVDDESPGPRLGPHSFFTSARLRLKARSPSSPSSLAFGTYDM
ncbi:hypothetical protein EMIHUDRAFT_349469, partial [Emiliania huxleyi CCMP1516]|uniref:Uncharacterized protein n=2 Tax=Emiliania huxleyi TaxID=2903 RepID=A0A0D3JGS9_EMIH1